MILKNKSLLFLILFPVVALGQVEISARDAVFEALENNYQIQIANLQHDINRKNNSWSEAGLFPTVTLNAGQSNTVQDNSNNPFTLMPPQVLMQGINPSLQMNWNLFAGFQVRASKLRLEQLEEQSANNAMAMIETTIQDVLKAYYTAQLQEERLALFEQVMELSQRRFKLYELKEKYSSSSSLELLQFRNQYLTDSTNYLMQEISLLNAKRNLQLLMNDTLNEARDYVLTDKIEIPLEDVSFDNAKDEMLANNQNLKNQYISIELQKSNTAFQRSFLYPTLSFQAGVNPSWSWLRDMDDLQADPFETSSLNYYGNFNLRYTLFNNWKSKRAVEVSKIQEEIAELNVDQMKQSLSNTLENLIELYNVRVQLVSISQENVDYAQKAFKLAERRFELGSISSIDLATFQNNYENTMIQYYENLFNRLDTYLEIYKLTGKISLDYSRSK